MEPTSTVHDTGIADAPRRMVLPSMQRNGYTVTSAFQPIFSFSHRRLVGHEALLRAQDADGRFLPPPAFFEQCRDARSLRQLDADCSKLHIEGFSQAQRRREWLFLNVDASAFDPACDAREAGSALPEMVRAAGLSTRQVAIELLEAELPDGPGFEQWTRQLKALGFLLALDDFGAGQSNFDRVFRLQPHVVKLDQSVIRRAGRSATVRRAMAQMISLLHQCGALVLVEGVETAEEAAIALDSDAEFVQGFHFGRPEAQFCPSDASNEAMLGVWARCDERSRLVMTSYRQRIRPYGEALMAVMASLQNGTCFSEACAAFFALEHADLCFLLDEDGAQLDHNVLYKNPPPAELHSHLFAPLLAVDGARWSRRPYFRRAMATFGQLQVTRPYPTMHSRQMSVTFSVAFTLRGRGVVLCGDKLWDDRFEQPGFCQTVADPLI